MTNMDCQNTLQITKIQNISYIAYNLIIYSYLSINIFRILTIKLYEIKYNCVKTNFIFRLPYCKENHIHNNYFKFSLDVQKIR